MQKTVGVVGAGLMGAGIAEVAARAGYAVILIDADANALTKGMARLQSSVKKAVEKGKLEPAEAEKIIPRVRRGAAYEDLAPVELVIEAVYENLAVKKEMFKKLDAIVKPEEIVQHTSALSITEISAVTRRPEKVIGLHFFYPAPIMKLVEIVRGLATSDATYNQARAFVEQTGKTAVLAQDYPGFIVNRLLISMINEAVFCVMEGAKPQDVDAAMKLGCGHPMGPLELLDFVGLDVALATLNGIYQGMGDSKYRPCPLFVKMVEAGWLGRKSGRGFYTYQ